MNEQQLTTFVEVAKKRNFRQAAEFLNLTQPAVSAQIRTLEDELGTTLFYRTHVRLTPSGSLFYPYARHILDLIHESKSILSDHKESPISTLTIGALPSLSLAILSRVTKYFDREMNPSSPSLRILTSSSEQLIQQLSEGQVDFGISYQIEPIPSFLESRTLFLDSFSLIVPNHHELAKVGFCSPRQLSKIPFITFAPSTTERTLINHLLKQFAIQPTIVMELSSVEEIKQCVATGYGVALIPTISLHSDHSVVTRIRVTSFEHSFPVLLYLPAQRYQSRSLKQLVNDISGIYQVENES
ncbi:LysR family transcriptional regulator [Hazenella coriacea]|uniref:DNA-binding transcriptional LysR family regulator n=1 Tax=Hazenella coriacea TaxID=1179467 RepID=A0A4R3L7M4_9BACL|nr:LysR family transcriptional regulator [Hazenella coriacea]TCS95035.1 DNA-binding transcriptional LysR family regulator [Hazenella coriacea]